MQNFGKYMLVVLVKSILKLLWLLPIKKNRILFYSFSGEQYSCNPKYLTEYILKNKEKQYELIWAFKNPQNFTYLNERGVITVKFKSFRFFTYILTAKIIIDNDTAPAYIPFRKEQFILSTWHGGGAYKKVALDDKYNNFFQRKNLITTSKAISKMISSCQKFTKVMSQAYAIPYNKFIPCGMPRNDILVNKNRRDLFLKVRVYFNISVDTHILLYAPTYRGPAKSMKGDFCKKNFIDINKLKCSLRKRFGGQWCVMYRAHHYMYENFVDDSVINVSDYPDMQELLYAVDVLITDYSSSIWDFSFTYKPCFLFATDLDQYNSERGFYTPIQSWPFPLAQNNDELEKVILNFDEDKYRKDVQHHHKELGSYEKGNACETVCKLLFSLK